VEAVILSAAKNLRCGDHRFFQNSPGGRLQGMTTSGDRAF